jgi:hypothetical protein
MAGLKLEVSIPEQKAVLFQDDRVVWEASCSTSCFGTGPESGSYKTPAGLFHISEKIGAGSAPGTIFKSRLPTGEVWTPDSATEEDLVLTRILWLAGDEPENTNTKDRYIYFHGTNHEALLGTPASHGCIRLSNQDIITLFDLVEAGTPVSIF